MNTRSCSLGTIHLVLHDTVWQEMRARKEQFARWPVSPAELRTELSAFEQGVPAFWQEGRGKWQGQDQIMICTPSYYFLAVPSPKNDAYFVPWMEPLTLHQHERLARGALLLRASAWCVHTGYDTIPQGSRNDLERVLRAWQALQVQVTTVSPPTDTPSPMHESYLNTLSQLIEVACQLALDKAALDPPIGYRAVESTGEVRYTARDLYTFLLASSTPRLKKGDFLRLRDDPDLRGQVYSLTGDRLTVKFEGPVDRASIPEQGVLEQSVSTLPYILQQQAIETLRAGESRNPYLLPILVDGVYQPYRTAATQPDSALNPAQMEAFRRSLTVPDLLLVLGPPGTGKTRTIAEIVRQHGAERRRVLVTAKTHKAVDNVLERLRDGLTVVRVGHEDRVSDDTKHLLLDAQARKLQASLLERTEAHAQALSNLVVHLDQVEQQVGRLPALIAALERAEVHLQATQQQIEAADAQIRTYYGREMRCLRESLQHQHARLERLAIKLNDLARCRASAEARGATFPLGLAWRWWSNHLARRMTQRRDERRQAQVTYDADARAYIQAQTAMRRATRTPKYHQLRQQVAEAEQAHRAAVQSAMEVALRLDRVVAGLAPSRPSLETVRAAALRRYLAWLRDSIPLLRHRRAILTEWRTRLQARSEELTPVLIRFADVVGATCIGIATDADFRHVDFDLVVADEAGQIGLPDLLVPLVRAARALLVGDHNQLPPFVADEVQQWLRQVTPESLPDLAWVDEEGTEAEAVTAFLTQSAFESLFPTAELAHVVRFNQQYRMPQVVADFAAQRFYDGQLDTAAREKQYSVSHSDPLFVRPLVFVDTSALPLEERKESSPRRGESDPEGWGMTGYLNRLEARLIADIVCAYDRDGMDWVAIVPYRAQAQQIRRILESKLPSGRSLNLEERVSTVDSFQGGECNRVIYGFTRSNSQGRVGFLRELRRLNVAMTRAMQQLVLVGDVSTLAHAHDQPFRDTAQALLAHVRRRGELLSYAECQARLTARQPEMP